MSALPRILIMLTVLATIAGCQGSETDSLTRPELKSLHIEFSELADWAGDGAIVSNAQGHASFKWKIIGSVTAAVCLIFLLAVGFKKGIVGFLFCGLLIATSVYALMFSQQEAKELAGLLDEVNGYNKLVKHIDLLHQLGDIGNDVKLKDHKSVLAALSTTEQNLKKAIKTERIFRENPELDPDKLDEQLGLVSIATIELDEKTGELAEALNSTIRIQRKVQERMSNLLGLEPGELVPIETAPLTANPQDVVETETENPDDNQNGASSPPSTSSSQPDESQPSRTSIQQQFSNEKPAKRKGISVKQSGSN